jgi:hypothetical protein
MYGRNTHPFGFGGFYGTYLAFTFELITLDSVPNFVGGRVQQNDDFLQHVVVADLY